MEKTENRNVCDTVSDTVSDGAEGAYKGTEKLCEQTSNSESGNKLKTTEEAESYVKSVMSQYVPLVANNDDLTLSSQTLHTLITPVRTGRKRHLSLPNVNESNVKKVKSSEDSDGCSTTSERVTAKAKRNILSKEEKLKQTKGKDKLDKSRKDGEKDCSNKSKQRLINTKKDRTTSKNISATKNKALTGSPKAGTSHQSQIQNDFNHTSDTSVILKALEDMRSGLENKIDTIDKKNNDKLEKLQYELNSIRADFNQRMEGLAKKVESRVIKVVENDTKDKLKAFEKEIKKDIDKLKQNIVRTETGVKRVSQTIIPTVQEKIGDEIDSLTERIAQLEKKNRDNNSHDQMDQTEYRKRRVVIRNLNERDNENIKDRVNNIIDYLKVKDVTVESAERKMNNYNSKPGVILATFYSYDDKEKVMKEKMNLKNSSRYRDVYIENDIPVHQRKLKNNLRTIVKTLGGEKLKFTGSRVVRAEDNQVNGQYRNSHEDEFVNRRNVEHRRDSFEAPRHDTHRQSFTSHSRESHYRDNDRYYTPQYRRDNRERGSRGQGNDYRRH